MNNDFGIRLFLSVSKLEPWGLFEWGNIGYCYMVAFKNAGIPLKVISSNLGDLREYAWNRHTALFTGPTPIRFANVVIGGEYERLYTDGVYNIAILGGWPIHKGLFVSLKKYALVVLPTYNYWMLLRENHLEHLEDINEINFYVASPEKLLVHTLKEIGL